MLINDKKYYQKCKIKWQNGRGLDHVTHFKILAFEVLPSCYLASFQNKGNAKMAAVKIQDQFSDFYTLVKLCL